MILALGGSRRRNAMELESILTSIKKMLGIEEEYEHFDPDLIMHINSAFMVLNQLGVGPSEGFTIEDAEATWADYIGVGSDIEAVKSYVYLKVQLLFDPPDRAAVLEAKKSMINEFEWRLLVKAESTDSE
jgi:hypothetical protein